MLTFSFYEKDFWIKFCHTFIVRAHVKVDYMMVTERLAFPGPFKILPEVLFSFEQCSSVLSKTIAYRV